MIKAKIEYKVNNRKTFEDKVLPYIYGGGIFYKTNVSIHEIDRNTFSMITKTNTLSQLITTTTGMLRYSQNCLLQRIEIIKTHKVNSKDGNKLRVKRPILGVILKPSLSYKPDIVKNLIKYAVKYGIDFVKDDDASEYSIKESEQIKNLAKGIPYLQKITNLSNSVSDYAMIAPWVDGWQLLENTSKRKITASHCANLSPQISWYTHLIFSRLAGASLAIVPDPLFDNTFNLDLALNAATKEIRGVKPIRILISGGITPERINAILKTANKRHYQYIGFSVGSWLLSYFNDLDKNYSLLKNEFMKYY